MNYNIAEAPLAQESTPIIEGVSPAPAHTLGNERAKKGAAAAVSFLQQLDARGRHNLCGMKPDGPIEGRSFEPDAWSEITHWIEARWQTHNLYFSVNEPSATAPNKKLTKSEIASIRCISEDIDPERGDLDIARATLRKRIKEAVKNRSLPQPTTVVDTGGGYQAHWLLEEKLDANNTTAWAEGQARAFAEKLGGDSTHNIDRLMRLPGTRNLPDRKKREIGRIDADTRIIHQSERRFSVDELAAYSPPAYEPAVTDRSPQIAAYIADLEREGYDGADSFDELEEELRNKFYEDSDHLRLALEGIRPPGGDTSASGRRAGLAQAIGRINQRSPGRYSVVDYARIVYAWSLSVQPGDTRDTKLTSRQLAREFARITDTVAERDAARDAKNYETLNPVTSEVPTSGNAQLTRMPFALLSFSDVASTALTGSTPFLIKGLLDQGTLSVMYGPSNVGKSFLALLISFFIAIGRTFGGMRVAKGTVVYVAAEGGRGVRKRVEALRRKFGHSDADLQFLLMSLDLRRSDADVGPLIEALAALGRPVIFLVLDTLSRVMAGGDENSSVDMGALVRNIDRIRTATGAHIMLVHHSGKDQAKGARGHSLLRAATDTEIEVNAGEVIVTKQRDLDKSWSSAFTLPVVTLGQDLDGEPITSCVLELVPKQDKPSGKATPNEQMVLNALSDILSREPSRHAKAIEIVEHLKGSGHSLTISGVRAHLKHLDKKKLVTFVKPDQWRPKAPKMTSATWYEEITDAPSDDKGLAEPVAEGVFK